MAIWGASDLRSLCSTGVPVTFKGVSTYPDGYPIKGLLDRAMKIDLREEGIGGIANAQSELRLPFNAFSPMPDADDTVTVDGTDYTVGPPTAEDDGAFLVYELRLASE